MGFDTDIVIGLEIHVGINTKTKLFCGCPTGGGEPNTKICEVCLGMPGSKPALNRLAVEHGIKLALAAQSRLATELVFSRKSYFYPDLAKNFQISQYEMPLAKGGRISLADGKDIALTRIHLEEDPASLVHPASMQDSPFVLVDYNRSGNPLLEIVTEPVLESPEQARDFLKQLITLLGYLEIFDVNEGVIKADANISIRESGYRRVELKNITGFREIERALNYEIKRQLSDVKQGKEIAIETRAWDSSRCMSFSLRLKESEDDYGYIIDPDLVPTIISENMVKRIRKQIPELAADKLKKFLSEHKIEETTANVLAKDKRLAEMYEAVSSKTDRELASKWIRRELPRVLNYNKKTLEESKITPGHMVSLLRLIENGRITERVGQQLINRLGEKPYDIESYVKENKLEAVSDSGELENFCREAIDENKSAVEEYRAGKEKALNFLIGKVMQRTRGQAKPDVVREIMIRLIS